jgi:hypothetical protein
VVCWNGREVARGYRCLGAKQGRGAALVPPMSLPIAFRFDGFYIEDGVHRAVAARQIGLTAIPAVLYEAGQPPKTVSVPLDQLHSPKASIRLSDPRHNYPALEAAMRTPLGRSRIPPISIQPLGAPGQTQSIPLDQVTIDP